MLDQSISHLFWKKEGRSRVKKSLPAILITENQPDIRNQVLVSNISPEGLTLQTDSLLSLQQQVRLELETSLGKLSLSATVIWKEEPCYRCQFVDVLPKVASLLSQWLFPPFEP